MSEAFAPYHHTHSLLSSNTLAPFIGLKTKRCFGSPVRDGPGVMLFPPLGSGDKLEGEWVDGQPGSIAMAAKLTWLWAKNGPSLATRDVGAVGPGMPG